MLLFQSEESVDRWCAAQRVERGEVLTIDLVWELSNRWYHNRLLPEYHGRTMNEVLAIFGQLGLTSQFWQPGAPAGAQNK